MNKALMEVENHCAICGIPLDAEYFDASGFVSGFNGNGAPSDNFKSIASPLALPSMGESRVLASYQLHTQYCGILTYFAQYTDLYAKHNEEILTPGFEWIIMQNGKPVFPYFNMEMIVNPWGNNCLPIAIRLDENAKIEFIIRNRSVVDEDLKYPMPGNPVYPIRTFAGRIMGRFWYNDIYGGRSNK